MYKRRPAADTCHHILLTRSLRAHPVNCVLSQSQLSSSVSSVLLTTTNRKNLPLVYLLSSTFPGRRIEMGSLMAGWDSPVLGDDNKVRARRNRSLTKEEVVAFWKQRRKPEDGGGEVTSPGTSPFGSLEKTRSPASSSPAARGIIKAETGTTGPSSSSPASRVEGFRPGDDDGESPSKSRDWWTRSSWAFLNEPPQEEAAGQAQSYAPQFHVARIATTGNA